MTRLWALIALVMAIALLTAVAPTPSPSPKPTPYLVCPKVGHPDAGDCAFVTPRPR